MRTTREETRTRVELAVSIETRPKDLEPETLATWTSTPEEAETGASDRQTPATPTLVPEADPTPET